MFLEKFDLIPRNNKEFKINLISLAEVLYRSFSVGDGKNNRLEKYSLALGLGDGALILRRGEQADVRKLPNRHFYLFHSPVAIVRYVHVHSYVLAVMIKLLVEGGLQVQFVRGHHKLFADLHRRLLALFRWRIHDLPDRQPHAAPAS